MLCIRGAVTADRNEKEEILEKTTEMLKAILEENGLEIETIRTILFTMTRDLDAVYPAVAARALGISSASLMCMQELYVAGSLPMCVRVMVVAEGDVPQSSLRHVYLGGAQKLRPDLLKKQNSEAAQ